jgi:hypothetical protein
MPRKLLLPIIVCLSALTLFACEKKGPAERAGEKVDHAMDTLKNGGHEPMRDKVQDKMDAARAKVNKAADDVKKAL